MLKLESKTKLFIIRLKFAKKTLNPFWNEEFILNPSDIEKDILLVKIYDWDANTSDDLLGEMEYAVHLFVNKNPSEVWKPVMDKKGPGRFVTGTGELKMMVTLYDSTQQLHFPGQQAQGVPYVVVYPLPTQVFPIQMIPQQQGYIPYIYQNQVIPNQQPQLTTPNPNPPINSNPQSDPNLQHSNSQYSNQYALDPSTKNQNSNQNALGPSTKNPNSPPTQTKPDLPPR